MDKKIENDLIYLADTIAKPYYDKNRNIYLLNSIDQTDLCQIARMFVFITYGKIKERAIYNIPGNERKILLTLRVFLRRYLSSRLNQEHFYNAYNINAIKNGKATLTFEQLTKMKEKKVDLNESFEAVDIEESEETFINENVFSDFNVKFEDHLTFTVEEIKKFLPSEQLYDIFHDRAILGKTFDEIAKDRDCKSRQLAEQRYRKAVKLIKKNIKFDCLLLKKS